MAFNLERVRDRVARAGGDPERITIVGVTKTFGLDVVQAAVGAGLVDLGENYAQELQHKARDLAPSSGDAVPPIGGAAAPREIRWHFIGGLQTNKVRLIAPVVWLWQSVERFEAGKEIARRAPGARVLVQVNVSEEPSKGGCDPNQAAELVRKLGDLGLDVRGLMAIGRTGPPEEARPGFMLLRRLADDLGLAERSMGMSADLDQAVGEGATIVRIGSALFGPRARDR